jgi:hypothetical protein
VGGTMRVPTIRGIPINVYVSWLVLYGLITWTLVTGYLPRAAGPPDRRPLGQRAAGGVPPLRFCITRRSPFSSDDKEAFK